MNYNRDNFINTFSSLFNMALSELFKLLSHSDILWLLYILTCLSFLYIKLKLRWINFIIVDSPFLMFSNVATITKLSIHRMTKKMFLRKLKFVQKIK